VKMWWIMLLFSSGSSFSHDFEEACLPITVRAF
jgi:hypothetical protein